MTDPPSDPAPSKSSGPSATPPAQEGEGPPGSSEPFRVQVDQDLQDLIPNYLENRRKDVEKVRGALEKGDFATVRVVGHSMAGSGGGYGFPGITRIGRNLERYALEKNTEAARVSVRELELYLSKVVVDYV